MKPKFNEDTLSEQPAIEQLKRLQYKYIHGDKLDPELKDDCERFSRREVVLIHRLKQKLAEINPYPHHSDKFWKKVGAIIPDYEKRRDRLKEYSIQIGSFD